MEASRGQTEAQTDGGVEDDMQRDESEPGWNGCVFPRREGGREGKRRYAQLVGAKKKKKVRESGSHSVPGCGRHTAGSCWGAAARSSQLARLNSCA